MNNDKNITIELTKEEFEYFEKIYDMYMDFIQLSWCGKNGDGPIETIRDKFEKIKSQCS